MAEEKEKKKSKKGLIIALLLIIVIIAVAVAVVVLMNGPSDEEKAEEEKTTGVEWGDRYYVYLLEDFEEEVSEELDVEKIEEIEIAFVELEDFDYPVMLIEGLIEDEEMFAVTYVEDEEVKTSEYMYLSEYEYSDVSYLYNIENEEYDWYVHTTDDDYDCYKTLSDYVSGENESYVEFEKDETSDLESMVISDFDKTFVKANIEVEKAEITLGDEDEILNGVTELAGSYKTSSELLTDDVTADVEEKVLEVQEVLEELSKLLTEEEALEIGEELFEYGLDPRTYDWRTQTYYLGKSKKEITYSESITVDMIYGGYAFADASDVEDYFTENRLSELTSDKNPSPYGIEKIDGTWYYLEAPVGGQIYLFGSVLTSVDSITADEIVFTATSYFGSGETAYDDTISYSDYDNDYDWVMAAREAYDCTTETNKFVIKLEDGHWKIDQQVVVY